jgi:hypothetical protein
MPLLTNARPNGQCYCRCGLHAGPGRFFAQGHDRRAAAALESIGTNQTIIDRLVQAGYHFGPEGRNLRDDALNSGEGWEACPIQGCEVYGRGIGMRKHVAEAHSEQI